MRGMRDESIIASQNLMMGSATAIVTCKAVYMFCQQQAE